MLNVRIGNINFEAKCFLINKTYNISLKFVQQLIIYDSLL